MAWVEVSDNESDSRETWIDVEQIWALPNEENEQNNIPLGIGSPKDTGKQDGRNTAEDNCRTHLLY